MNKEDMSKLEVLYKAGVSAAEIVCQLGFCRQTIYNEINRELYIHTRNF